MRFKLREILLFVTVVALVLALVISNRQLSATHSELEEMTSKYEKVYSKYSDQKERDETYRKYFKMGCEYLDHKLYKEAIACFENAKQFRMEDEILDKLVDCFVAGGGELKHQLNDAELKRIFWTKPTLPLPAQKDPLLAPK